VEEDKGIFFKLSGYVPLTNKQIEHNTPCA